MLVLPLLTAAVPDRLSALNIDLSMDAVAYWLHIELANVNP